MVHPNEEHAERPGLIILREKRTQQRIRRQMRYILGEEKGETLYRDVRDHIEKYDSNESPACSELAWSFHLTVDALDNVSDADDEDRRKCASCQSQIAWSSLEVRDEKFYHQPCLEFLQKQPTDTNEEKREKLIQAVIRKPKPIPNKDEDQPLLRKDPSLVGKALMDHIGGHTGVTFKDAIRTVSHGKELQHEQSGKIEKITEQRRLGKRSGTNPHLLDEEKDDIPPERVSRMKRLGESIRSSSPKGDRDRDHRNAGGTLSRIVNSLRGKNKKKGKKKLQELEFETSLEPCPEPPEITDNLMKREPSMVGQVLIEQPDAYKNENYKDIIRKVNNAKTEKKKQYQHNAEKRAKRVSMQKEADQPMLDLDAGVQDPDAYDEL